MRSVSDLTQCISSITQKASILIDLFSWVLRRLNWICRQSVQVDGFSLEMLCTYVSDDQVV